MEVQQNKLKMFAIIRLHDVTKYVGDIKEYHTISPFLIELVTSDNKRYITSPSNVIIEIEGEKEYSLIFDSERNLLDDTDEFYFRTVSNYEENEQWQK